MELWYKGPKDLLDGKEWIPKWRFPQPCWPGWFDQVPVMEEDAAIAHINLSWGIADVLWVDWIVVHQWCSCSKLLVNFTLLDKKDFAEIIKNPEMRLSWILHVGQMELCKRAAGTFILRKERREREEMKWWKERWELRGQKMQAASDSGTQYRLNLCKLYQVLVTAKAGDIRNVGSIPGSGRSPGGGHGEPLQYSCLENPMDRGAWWTIVHGVAKSQTRLTCRSTHPQFVCSFWPLWVKLLWTFRFGFCVNRGFYFSGVNARGALARSCGSCMFCVFKQPLNCFPEWLYHFVSISSKWVIKSFPLFLVTIFVELPRLLRE